VPGKRRTLAGRRRMVGYTQEQLAAVLGVERTTVVRWEAGETCPQPWCRPKLARALDVSVEELDTMLAGDQTVEDERSGSSSELQDNGHLCDVDAAEEPKDDLEHDPVLVAPWNHRGTVDAVVLLSGGDLGEASRIRVLGRHGLDCSCSSVAGARTGATGPWVVWASYFGWHGAPVHSHDCRVAEDG
jgi:DNA-binding XRE family transcriptional regulator